MLLCLSSGRNKGFAVKLWERSEDLPSGVALYAPDDLTLRQAFGRPTGEVATGGSVVAHPGDGDDVERAVRCSVTAAAEAVSARCPATARRLGCDAAQLGECSLIADPVVVITHHHEELAGDLDTDPEQGHEIGRRPFDEGLDLAAKCLYLGIQSQPATSEVPQGSLRSSHQESLRVVAQLEQLVSLGPQTRTPLDEGPLRELDEL